MKCGNPSCNHPIENHRSSICNGDLTCFCEKFIEPVLEQFAQEVEANKATMKSVYDRSRYILRKLPPTRNAGEKSFADIYREIWYGFKIRAKGTTLTRKERKRMKHDDTINRAKRFVKADYPELKTYNPKVLYHQTALYQAIMEMSVE